MHIIFANFVIRLLFLFYFLTGSLTILNPFGFFACSVIRKLPYRKYGAMFLFYAKKSSDYAEDADYSKFRRIRTISSCHIPSNVLYSRFMCLTFKWLPLVG